MNVSVVKTCQTSGRARAGCQRLTVVVPGQSLFSAQASCVLYWKRFPQETVRSLSGDFDGRARTVISASIGRTSSIACRAPGSWPHPTLQSAWLTEPVMFPCLTFDHIWKMVKRNAAVFDGATIHVGAITREQGHLRRRDEILPSSVAVLHIEK